MVFHRLFAGREEEKVEHGNVALIEERSLEEEPVECRVEGRLGRCDHLERVGEEEGDDGRDRLAHLTEDTVPGVGEDEEDFFSLAEG